MLACEGQIAAQAVDDTSEMATVHPKTPAIVSAEAKRQPRTSLPHRVGPAACSAPADAIAAVAATSEAGAAPPDPPEAAEIGSDRA